MAAPARRGDEGPPALGNIGEAEPMELRFEAREEFRRRTRRMMRKARRHVAAIARKPRTTMTAIAQRGNSEVWGAP